MPATAEVTIYNSPTCPEQLLADNIMAEVRTVYAKGLDIETARRIVTDPAAFWVKVTVERVGAEATTP